MEKINKKRSSRFRSISASSLVCFVPVIIIALLFIYGFSFHYTEENAREISSNYILQLIGQVKRDIDSYITYMENITRMSSGIGDVLEFSKADGDEEHREFEQNIIRQFQIVLETRDDIRNIGVVCKHGKTVINDGKTVQNPWVDIRQQPWYQAALNAPPGTMVLSSSHVQNVIWNEYPWVVTLSSGLGLPVDSGNSGVFFIDLNYSAIRELCESIDLGNRGYVFILDRDGNILYHPRQQLIYSGLTQELTKEVLSTAANRFVSGTGKDQKLYMITASEKTGWTVAGVCYMSELMKNRRQTWLVYTLVTLLLLFVLIGIVGILSTRITRPVVLLEEAMKKAKKGDFAKINLTEFPDNEIGSLGRTFNIMSDEIQNLMDENIREQEQKRKNELQVLQAQINPHFLYNTLDSIVWMAESGKNKEVVMMTLALSRLFRRSISDEKELISIGQEAEYVRNYLEIQQMRYQDKLSYRLDIDEEIMDEKVIKLVLQPLVENAIYHGIKYREAGGLICITGKREGDHILLNVIDNGPGMTKEQLGQIFEKHKVNYMKNGVGVYNVQSRLQLYYGKEYGIRYESTLQEGTTATLCIPAGKGGNKNERS